MNPVNLQLHIPLSTPKENPSVNFVFQLDLKKKKNCCKKWKKDKQCKKCPINI